MSRHLLVSTDLPTENRLSSFAGATQNDELDDVLNRLVTGVVESKLMIVGITT